MGLRAGETYSGVIAAADWMESSKGTPGLRVRLETDDMENEINHVFWVTENSKDFFLQRMLDFGMTQEQLASGAFLTNELPTKLVGLEVKFGTKEETYKDQTQIKVAWIGTKKAPSDERGIGYAVAQMFGGEAGKKVAPKAKETEEDPIDDSDIPF